MRSHEDTTMPASSESNFTRVPPSSWPTTRPRSERPEAAWRTVTVVPAGAATAGVSRTPPAETLSSRHPTVFHATSTSSGADTG